nr:MAG TPA: hypothetical protein [Caudoviricetes sp.]
MEVAVAFHEVQIVQPQQQSRCSSDSPDAPSCLYTMQ